MVWFEASLAHMLAARPSRWLAWMVLMADGIIGYATLMLHPTVLSMRMLEVQMGRKGHSTSVAIGAYLLIGRVDHGVYLKMDGFERRSVFCRHE